MNLEKNHRRKQKTGVEGKTVSLEYDNYKADKFGRIFCICDRWDGKTFQLNPARKGVAQVVVYQREKPLFIKIYCCKASKMKPKESSASGANNLLLQHANMVLSHHDIDQDRKLLLKL